MASDKDSKLKALQLTLDRLDKTYGKGTVMKMGDSVHEAVESISLPATIKRKLPFVSTKLGSTKAGKRR